MINNVFLFLGEMIRKKYLGTVLHQIRFLQEVKK